MSLNIVLADYLNRQHAGDIIMLLDHYASGAMGGGKPLDHSVKANLVGSLSKLPHAFTVIAYDGNRAVGLVNCFEAFSTFLCKPIVNIHDVVVTDEYRGQGIAGKMLEKVESIARSKGCCKLTLEVLSNNESAKAAYRKFGFSDYVLDSEAGAAMFWQKLL